MSLVGLPAADLVYVVEAFVAVSSSLASSSHAPKTNAKSRAGGGLRRAPRQQDQRVRDAREQAMIMFFGGSTGVMLKLYAGWFKKTGQIAKDILTCTKSALKGVRWLTSFRIEIYRIHTKREARAGRSCSCVWQGTILKNVNRFGIVVVTVHSSREL